MDCLFCKIASGEIPSKKLYEDEKVYAFYDIAPAAPVHVLVIPKAHIGGANDVTAENAQIIAYIFTLIPKLAKKLGLSNGYRVVTNCGADAGQTVPHLHFHILGGDTLGKMA